MQFQEKREKKKKREEKFYPTVEKKEGKECPHCNTVNEEEAKFCEDCGYDFTTGLRCPNCNVTVSANADICEACGEWLLEGKCKFCYAAIEEGATYCGECGNPTAGINCPQCGELSYFDFCKKCNIPLTGMAQKMQEEIKNNPEELELLELIESSAHEKNEVMTTQENELFKLKAYVQRVEEKRKVTFKPIFSEKQRGRIREADIEVEKEIKKREEEKRKQEEERRRREAQQQKKLQILLEQIKKTTFSNNQEARRYFNVRRPTNSIGWECNFTGAVHSCPEDCAEPWHGGQWVI